MWRDLVKREFWKGFLFGAVGFGVLGILIMGRERVWAGKDRWAGRQSRRLDHVSRRIAKPFEQLRR